MQDIWNWLLNLKDAQLHGGRLAMTSPWPAWLAVAATIAVIAGVASIYRRDGGSRVGKVIGATLRCLLLILLLVLIWQPVIRVEQSSKLPGVVAVLVDVSRSMSTADPYGSDDPAVLDLAAVEAAKAAASQPDSKAQKPNATDPIYIARAMKMLAGKSRIQAIHDVLEYNDREAIHKLLANNELILYTFDGVHHEVARLAKQDSSNAADLDRQIQARLASLTDASAIGPATNVSQAVTGVINDLRGQRLAGVIVISDGRSTEPEKAGKESAVDLATKLAVPIHTVTVGSIHPPREVTVSRLMAEPTVFVNDWVAVKAMVKQTGVTKPERVKVHLLRMSPKKPDRPEEEWLKLPIEDRYEVAKELDSREMTVGEQATDADPTHAARTKREQETELRFRPNEKGVYDLAARVELLDTPSSQPDVRLVTRPITVVDDKIKVLLIDGLPRWEYRFVAHSLIREKTVEPSIWLMTADEDFAQEGRIDPVSGLSTAIARLPDKPEEWNKFDVVILGDVNPLVDLTKAQQEQIEAFVRDQAGGFAMIAGEQNAPNRYAYADSPIARLLPVEIDPNAGPDRVNRVNGFKMRLTQDGRRSPILRFEELPELNEATINAFPDFYWYKSVAGLKPGAEAVLAEHPTAKMADGVPAPLFVCGRYGAGKTYFSAVDDTWRWRMHTGTPYFDTYWLQLVRYLSANKLLGSDRRFELSTDQTVYDRGQRIRVLLQLLDRKLVNLPDTVKVKVTSNKQEVATIDLRRSGKSYEGEFDKAGDGNWIFTLDENSVRAGFGLAPSDHNQKMPEASVYVADNSPEELDLSIDSEVFPRLATLTLGKSVTLAGLSDLASAKKPDGKLIIPDMSKVESYDKDHPLWNTNLALGLFALLITAEWILRKRYNLQ